MNIFKKAALLSMALTFISVARASAMVDGDPLPEDEERAFNAGIVDYIIKPIRPAIVLARVRNQLLLRHARHWLLDQNHALEAEVARRLRENDLISAVSMRALAHLAETRDSETGCHIQRTQNYVLALANRLAKHPRFAATLDNKYIETLARSAPLHDIGKVGIPDHILLKPGKLTPAEWEIMKTHTVLGSEAITLAERDLDRPEPPDLRRTLEDDDPDGSAPRRGAPGRALRPQARGRNHRAQVRLAAIEPAPRQRRTMERRPPRR